MKRFASIALALLLTAGMAVPAAATFTSSVTAKPAPPVVQMQDNSGKQVNAVITDSSGKEIAALTDSSEIKLVVTPISEVENTEIKEIAEMLQQAKEQVGSSNSVAELTTEMTTVLEEVKAAAAEVMQNALQGILPGGNQGSQSENAGSTSSNPLAAAMSTETAAALQDMKVEDLVICDLFDVSLVKNDTELVNLEAGQQSTFYLQTNLRPGDVFFLLHNYAPGQWEVITDAEVDANGLMKVTLTSHSPLAIVVDSNEYLLKTNGSTSPATGVQSAAPLMAAAVCLTAAAVFAVRSRKED